MKLIPMMMIYLKCLDLNKAHVHEDWSVRMIGQSLDLNGQLPDFFGYPWTII